MSDAQQLAEEIEITLGSPFAEAPPRVKLIDARTLGLPDEALLREHARELCARSAAPHSSRSYSFPLALIAWHTAPVGVDVERIGPCDAVFADSIRTPTERAAGWPSEDPDRFFTSLWSSKEALSKALGDALQYDPRRLEGAGAWPDKRSGPWRAEALDVGSEHVGWLCWCTTHQP
ncbi:MAG: 4'-phosphopantetheinyl transferase family protein [Solirubrobacteraceae bacterium]